MRNVRPIIERKVAEILVVGVSSGLANFAAIYPSRDFGSAVQAVLASLLAAAVFYLIFLYGPLSSLFELAARRVIKTAWMRAAVSASLLGLYSLFTLWWQQLHPERFLPGVIVSALALFAFSVVWEKSTDHRYV